MERDTQTALLSGRYAAALLAGNHEEASRVVRDALDRGVDPATIYTEMLGPALVEVGNAWLRDELNIAAEHLATSITFQQIAYVRDVARRKKSRGVRAVVAAVEGEMHSVGVTMIADLLHVEGWDVAHLGQDTPTDDLVELVKERGADLVILSLADPDRIGVAARAAAMLKALDRPPAVFVGGSGLSSPDEGDRIPADLISSDPQEAIGAATEILGLNRGQPTLEDHLSALGRSVQELRKRRGWSQQELAGRADLDRTYLSTVERGSQNITIGAAVRIAHALGVSLSELIDLDEGPLRRP